MRLVQIENHGLTSMVANSVGLSCKTTFVPEGYVPNVPTSDPAMACNLGDAAPQRMDTHLSKMPDAGYFTQGLRTDIE